MKAEESDQEPSL
jgi:hypothetical protein